MSKMNARVHYESKLSAVLIRKNGEAISLGDMDRRKSWWQRFWERLHFDERGYVTNTGVTDLTTDFTSSGGMAVFKYHSTGTGTTAASVTQTALVTETTSGGGGPSTRPFPAGGNTSTAASGGSGSSGGTAATVGSVATVAYTGTFAITEWGLFNSATLAAGDMFDRRVFSAINVVSGDSIQFTYVLSVAAGGS